MKYNRYHDAKAFYEKVYPILMRHEVQNTLPLGNVILGNSGGEPEGWRNTKHWFMATVDGDDGAALLTAIMTPPFNITMYETDNRPDDESLDCLIENMTGAGVEVPGITTENRLAERFARAYMSKMDGTFRVQKDMRIYKLSHVSDDIHIRGGIRHAKKSDLSFLPYWYRGFHDDCRLGETNFDEALPACERLIEKKILYILEDEGIPVSMAATSKEVVNGWCVSDVYTPPYFRNKGYALSCVAQVSRGVLERGYEYVSLFADLANPISNSIYQKIGYMPVCDYNELDFKP